MGDNNRSGRLTEQLSYDEVLRQARALNLNSDHPAYVTIASWLTRLLDQDLLRPGQHMPPERLLASHLGVSRMTLRQSLEQLKRSGRIIRQTDGKRGFVVEDHRAVVDLSQLNGFRAQVLRSARVVSTRIVRAGTIPTTPDAADALCLADGDRVHEVVRVREVDGQPVVLENSYFPADRFPSMLDLNLDGSMYDLLRDEYDCAPHTAQDELLPVDPKGPGAKLLESDGMSVPLLQMTRTAWARDGAPIEYSADLFRLDHLRIIVSGRVPTP